jgi:hypothetical protein
MVRLMVLAGREDDKKWENLTRRCSVRAVCALGGQVSSTLEQYRSDRESSRGMLEVDARDAAAAESQPTGRERPLPTQPGSRAKRERPRRQAAGGKRKIVAMTV